MEFNSKCARVTGKVTAGKVMVDGLGVGDVGNIVLRDRKQLSQDGILIVVVTINRQNSEIVAGPDIVSRFVYVRIRRTMEESKARVKQALEKCRNKNAMEWATIKAEVRESLANFLWEKTRRRPMIMPIIMEI